MPRFTANNDGFFLFRVLTEGLDAKKADEYVLILTAKNIIGIKEPLNNGYMILVPQQDYARASSEIRQYFLENSLQNAPTAYTFPKVQWTDFIPGIWVCVILLVIHYKTTVDYNHSYIIQTFGASAYKITHGDFHLSFTALLLHSGWSHLFGNIAGLILFGGFLSAYLTAWKAWSLTIFSGISGNLFNAFFHQKFHLAIGASTAVFGAVGILSGIHIIHYLNKDITRLQMMKPIGAGLALTAFLGAGENADITGHIAGFVSGVAIGMVYSLIYQTRTNKTTLNNGET